MQQPAPRALDPNKPSTLAIIIILACSLFLIFKYLMNVSVSIMTPELMSTFHIRGIGLGFLGSTFLASYLVFQLFSGPLLDSFSVRTVASLAIATSVVGLVLFGWAQEFWEALIGRGLQGVGAAFATVTYLKLAANWFHPRYFARIAGFLATAAMIGAIAGDAPLALVNQHFGWRAAIIVCLSFGIFLMLAFWFIVRNQPKETVVTELATDPDHKVTWRDVTNILRRPLNWLVLLYTGLAFSPVAVFSSLWGNPFLHSVYKISVNDVPLYSTLMFVGLAFGGPALGALSDAVRNRGMVMFASTAGTLVFMLLAVYCNTQPRWLLATELFLAGFTTGGFLLGFSIVKEYNPIFLAGTVIAFANTGDPVVGAWTDPIIGWILDNHWNHTLFNGAPIYSPHAYHMSMIVLMSNLVLACILVCVITPLRRYHARQKQQLRS
jgi:predicted MFS family arabinose efflux permease